MPTWGGILESLSWMNCDVVTHEFERTVLGLRVTFLRVLASVKSMTGSHRLYRVGNKLIFWFHVALCVVPILNSYQPRHVPTSTCLRTYVHHLVNISCITHQGNRGIWIYNRKRQTTIITNVVHNTVVLAWWWATKNGDCLLWQIFGTGNTRRQFWHDMKLDKMLHYLPLDMIKLCNKIVPCHVGVRAWAVIRVDLHPLGRVLGGHSGCMAR